MEANDKTPIVSGSPSSVAQITGDGGPIYHDSTKGQRVLQVVFVALVVVMVAVSVILSIYQGAKLGGNRGLYFLLGLSLLGFVLIEIFLIRFIQKGDLPKEKTWFLYLMGACIIIQAIFTDVLLFD